MGTKLQGPRQSFPADFVPGEKPTFCFLPHGHSIMPDIADYEGGCVDSQQGSGSLSSGALSNDNHSSSEPSRKRRPRRKSADNGRSSKRHRLLRSESDLTKTTGESDLDMLDTIHSHDLDAELFGDALGGDQTYTDLTDLHFDDTVRHVPAPVSTSFFGSGDGEMEDEELWLSERTDWSSGQETGPDFGPDRVQNLEKTAAPALLLPSLDGIVADFGFEEIDLVTACAAGTVGRFAEPVSLQISDAPAAFFERMDMAETESGAESDAVDSDSSGIDSGNDSWHCSPVLKGNSRGQLVRMDSPYDDESTNTLDEPWGKWLDQGSCSVHDLATVQQAKSSGTKFFDSEMAMNEDDIFDDLVL